MRLAFEQKLREKHSGKYEVIITEFLDTRSGNKYCRVHRNFHDSDRIQDATFEELCEQYKLN